MTLVSCWVPGVAQPQGSKRIFGGRLVEGNDKTLRPWRALVAGMARDSYAGETPTTEAVVVRLGFMFARPKSHYATSGALRRTAPAYKATRPDIDKLSRAVLDALTGIVFVEDSQVAGLTAWKDFGTPGVGIRVDFADVFALPPVEGFASGA